MYKIPLENFHALNQKIEGLAKRATKLGMTAPTLNVVSSETVSIKSYPYERTYMYVTVEGVHPTLSGWHFVATIELTEHGNLIRSTPYEDVPERYRTTDATCEHCNLTRYRNQVFVVRNEKHEYKQVGRACLADFLGGRSPEALASMAEYLSDVNEAIDGFVGGGGFAATSVTPTVYLAAVVAFVRVIGWMPRKLDPTYPTSEKAWDYVSSEKFREEWHAQGIEVSPDDHEFAKVLLAWVDEQDASTTYMHNLKVACKHESVTKETRGLIASAVSVYQREREEAIKREMRKPSEHVGTVGKREVFSDLKVVSARSFESDYGQRVMVQFADREDNVLVWWTSYEPEWLDDSTLHNIKATVKAHETYNGTKQTILTRATQV